MPKTTLPPLLTAGNARETVRAVLADEGYTGSFTIEEGAGWVLIVVERDATDEAIRVARERLGSIAHVCVELRITRAPR